MCAGVRHTPGASSLRTVQLVKGGPAPHWARCALASTPTVHTVAPKSLLTACIGVARAPSTGREALGKAFSVGS